MSTGAISLSLVLRRGQMMLNQSAEATAASFNVHVKLAAAESAAPVAAMDEATQGGQHQEVPVSVVSKILSTTTAALVAINGDGGSHGKIEQLEEGVDNIMKKMGIHGK